MFGGTALALLVVYTPVSNGTTYIRVFTALTYLFYVAIFHTSMALNPVYVLMPIVFGLLLFIVSCIKTFLNIRSKFSPTKNYHTYLMICRKFTGKSRNKLMNPFSEHIKNSIIVVTE